METQDIGIDSFDYRVELLSPALFKDTTTITNQTNYDEPSSWRISFDHHKLPQNHDASTFFSFPKFLQPQSKRRKTEVYYKRQQNLLQNFNQVDVFLELGNLPGGLTQSETRQVVRGERIAINASNIANLVLFMAKVYASIQSRSLAVIASTLDSLLDLLSGFILLFTAYAMKKPNPYTYPLGNTRMQPVGLVVFASIMATLGLQVLFESGRELIVKSQPERNVEKEKWMIGIMVSVTILKFILVLYCRQFKNEIVRAYCQDHLFDVITNTIGLAAAVLAIHFFWWIDPLGAIIIALYTMSSWAKTVMENVGCLIGKTAPPEYITKLVYLVWNHHEEISQIATVQAYSFGYQYFVEVDIVLPQQMSLHKAHNIGETLQEKLELLPEVERAFVHLDFDPLHHPEHKPRTNSSSSPTY